MITTTVLDNELIASSVIYYADFVYKEIDSNESVCLSNTVDNTYITIDLNSDYGSNIYQNKYAIRIRIFPIPQVCSNINISNLEYAKVILKSNLFLPLIQIQVNFQEDVFFIIQNLDSFQYFINLFIYIESYFGNTNLDISTQDFFVVHEQKDIKVPSVKTDFNLNLSNLKYKTPPYYSDSNQALLSSNRDRIFYMKEKSQDLFMLEDRISSCRSDNNKSIISFMSVRNEADYINYPDVLTLNLPILFSRDGTIFYNHKYLYRYTSGFLGFHPMYVFVQNNSFVDLCNQSILSNKSIFISPHMILNNKNNTQDLIYVDYKDVDKEERFSNYNRLKSVSVFAESFPITSSIFSIDYNKILNLDINEDICNNSKITFYYLMHNDQSMTLFKPIEYESIFKNRLILNSSLYPDSEDFYYIFTNILGTGAGYIMSRSRKKITHNNNTSNIYNYSLLHTYRTSYLINYLFSIFEYRKKIRDLNKYYYIHDMT
ncbi:MAG: hypothetical protein QXF12_00865 [Candidatus Aenigmatarchaeota archaeon]